MFRHVRNALFACIAASCFASPATAGWKLLNSAKPVRVGSMAVIPQSDWNQASARPGKQGAAWTHDGFGLNALEFFGGVPAGQPLYRERNAKRNPMPKYDSAMLAPELVEFFERSFRVQNQVADFAVEEIKPVSFGGRQGVMVRYRYTLVNDELGRRGVARLATADRKLFAANFHAPELHYFPAGLPEAEALMDSIRF